jgi:hypothetical protein
MKWGVRHDRERRPRKSLFRRISDYREGIKKDKLLRQKKNGLINESITYNEEYRKTKSGAKKLKRYHDAMILMESYSDGDAWMKKHGRDFMRAEEDYLKSAQRYEINKMLKKYNNNYKMIGRAMYGRDFKNANELRKAYIDDWRVHAY